MFAKLETFRRCTRYHRWSRRGQSHIDFRLYQLAEHYAPVESPPPPPPFFISIRAPRGSCKISAFIDSRNLLECFTTSVARAQAQNSHLQRCNGYVELQRGVICVTNGTGISFSQGGGLFYLFFSQGVGRAPERNAGQSVSRIIPGLVAGNPPPEVHVLVLVNSCFPAAGALVVVLYNIKDENCLNLPDANRMIAHVLFSGPE